MAKKKKKNKSGAVQQLAPPNADQAAAAAAAAAAQASQVVVETPEEVETEENAAEDYSEETYAEGIYKDMKKRLIRVFYLFSIALLNKKNPNGMSESVVLQAFWVFHIAKFYWANKKPFVAWKEFCNLKTNGCAGDMKWARPPYRAKNYNLSKHRHCILK